MLDGDDCFNKPSVQAIERRVIIFDIENEHLSTEEVAMQLLGRRLISETAEGVTTGWIVETEAYLGIEDMAAHTYGGRKTPRVRAMYDKPGTIYIYNMMGNLLLNIATRKEGNPQAVLIRAIQPEAGVEIMEKRRNKIGFELTNGPGKLTQALGISMKQYGTLITEPPLYIDFSQKLEPSEVLSTARIGIPNKEKWTSAPLRYIVKENPFVSRRKGKVDLVNYGWANFK